MLLNTVDFFLRFIKKKVRFLHSILRLKIEIDKKGLDF